MALPPPRQPTAPFADWPVQYFDPRVGFYWYVRPAAIVVQSVIGHGNVEAIDVQNDIVDRILEACPTEIRAAGGLLILCDWRTVKTYDQDARARQRVRMDARAPGYSRRTIIVVEPASRLLRMAIEGANLFSALTFKSRIELLTRADTALERAQLSPPSPTDAFPIRV